MIEKKTKENGEYFRILVTYQVTYSSVTGF